ELSFHSPEAIFVMHPLRMIHNGEIAIDEAYLLCRDCPVGKYSGKCHCQENFTGLAERLREHTGRGGLPPTVATAADNREGGQTAIHQGTVFEDFQRGPALGRCVALRCAPSIPAAKEREHRRLLSVGPRLNSRPWYRIAKGFVLSCNGKHS